MLQVAVTLATVVAAGTMRSALVANTNSPSLVPACVPAAIVYGSVSAFCSVNCSVVTAPCAPSRLTPSNCPR